jgi:hypothetical protein
MIWQEYARQLQAALALEGSPIGVSFSDFPAANGKENKIIPCESIKEGIAEPSRLCRKK